MVRILIVDDVAEIRLQLRLLLSANGYEVVEADGGVQAEALLGKQDFDLVITDVLMPEVDGIELIKVTKQRQPKARTLAISGGSRDIPAKWSLKMTQMFGADRSLYKPFSNDELLGAVGELLTGVAD